MEFTCRHTYENDYFQEWTGNWELLHYDGSFYELLINGRGSSFHSILGMSSVGLYMYPFHRCRMQSGRLD